jgi:hypothetical protein
MSSNKLKTKKILDRMKVKASKTNQDKASDEVEVVILKLRGKKRKK